MRRGAVVEEDDAVEEGFGGEGLEADGAMARLNLRRKANLANSVARHPAIRPTTTSN